MAESVVMNALAPVSGKQWLGVSLLLLAFLVVGALSCYDETGTIDEGGHLFYGNKLLEGTSDRLHPSRMPVTVLNALAGKVARHVYPFRDFFPERLATLVFSSLVGVVVFYWSNSLYGFVPAIVSLLCYIFDPNIIAHSQLITTDIYAAGTITIAFFLLWRFAHQRTLTNGILVAVALGLSQAAKYTAFVLLPLSLMAIFLYDLFRARDALRERTWPMLRRLATRCALYFAAALLVSITIINVVFLFNRTFTSFGDYKFRSGAFQRLQREYPQLAGVPIPVPYPYVEGLEWVTAMERSGVGIANLYLLEEVRRGTGFKGYYFIVSLLKVPIAIQLVTWAAVILYLLDRRRRQRFFSDEIFLAVPALFFAVYFNSFYNAQVGIRHYLVVFPFLYVFAGSLFIRWTAFSRWRKGFAFSLLAYLIVSVFSYYPYFLPYFNEIVWNRTQAYKYLGDSNLDWGQSGKELSEYLEKHPDAQFVKLIMGPGPTTPQAGHFVIAPNELVGVTVPPDRLAWLRNNFEPSDNIAYEFLVYRVTPHQVTELCATTDYCAP